MSLDDSSQTVDLTVVIPALHEAENLRLLLPALFDVLKQNIATYEVLVATRTDDPDTAQASRDCGATPIYQKEPGYGGALMAGFASARGVYVLTMDADFSHPPTFLKDLWANRANAEISIASRYVAGGSADMPRSRYWLSRVLNQFFGRGLSVPVRDMSSGYRLYKKSALHQLNLQQRDFSVLQEILVKSYCAGWHIQEIPFAYAPRKYGSSHARVLQFGISYIKTFRHLWQVRNSIAAADYDYRAHDSVIPLQRYWQRSRYQHIVELIAGQGEVLDVGCGSSHIISALPPRSISLDILIRKVRFAKRFNRNPVQGSVFQLPVPDESFPCVLCSQVIEHIPKDPVVLQELSRTLKKGGRLVLGTPDYANWEWVVTEKLYGMFAPGGYADEHISHYTQKELVDHFTKAGYKHIDTRYILQGEMILAFQKDE